LSRELHDSIGQSLGAIKYTLERIASAGDRLTAKESDAILATAIQGVTDAIKDTRSLALRLRPPILDDMGAVAALRYLVKQFSDTYSNVAFHVEFSVEPDAIPQVLTTPLYRIVQESLNNVVKHAQATSALVSLQRQSKFLVLEIVDDGVGFDATGKDTGQYRRLGNFGRLGMRERAIYSNGVLTIESSMGNGTKVQVEWELEND
jgi:signal transduction histidine kinase